MNVNRDVTKDNARLKELRNSLRNVDGNSEAAIEIREEMMEITSNYSDHDEFLEPDWDEACSCDTCMSYGDPEDGTE